MYLTKREEQMMNLFWQENRELAAYELEELLEDDPGWNHAAVYRTVKLLEDKGILRVSSLEKRTKQYARKFLPAVSQAEFYTEALLEKPLQKGVLNQISAALVERGMTGQEKKETVEQLEKILDDLKKQE
jgi:predicted transcriptional regulator